MTDLLSYPDTSGLLPCPFCGGKPRRAEGLNEHWISCASCQASSIMRGNVEAAISAWNARVPAQGSGDCGAWNEGLAQLRVAMMDMDILAYNAAKHRISKALNIFEKAIALSSTSGGTAA